MGAFGHLLGTIEASGTVTEHRDRDAFIKERGDAAFDPAAAREALLALTLSKEQRIVLRETNIAVTKRLIAESVSADRHIISAIGTIEELDKVANRLAKKLREWYALYDPELEHAHKDHRAFAATVLEHPQRAKDTMGGAFSEADIATVLAQAQALSTLYAQRDALLQYLERVMEERVPNLTAVAGPTIGANLIALAGSLRRLIMFPAGTVQLLGAESAFFKHLRNKKSRPPKHGIIFNHLLLQKAPPEKRGKVARVLADCISIAARVDYFRGEFVAEKLVKKAEAALR